MVLFWAQKLLVFTKLLVKVYGKDYNRSPSSLSAERSVLPLCYNASSIIKGLIKTHVRWSEKTFDVNLKKNSARNPHPENVECVMILTVSLGKLSFLYFELQLKVEKWVNDSFNVFRLTGPSGMYPLVFRELRACGGGKSSRMLRSWGAFSLTTSRKKAILGYVQRKSVHIRESASCTFWWFHFPILQWCSYWTHR